MLATLRRRLGLLVLPLLVAGAACGGDDPTGPDSGVDQLVGSWSATSMTVTNDANPSQSADLIEEGASFTINVQPSGQYTASLTFLGFPSTEIGFLRVEGNEIVFTREFPSAETSRAEFVLSGNQITLRGPTEFDFNGDSSGEAATLESVLIRQ